jgi:lipoate---protein ligase
VDDSSAQDGHSRVVSFDPGMPQGTHHTANLVAVIPISFAASTSGAAVFKPNRYLWSMKSLVFIDNDDNTDPADNLALEEYVLRRLDPSLDYLLLYRNEPSVIVGRNQNVLEEVNDSYVRDKGIPVFRRLSGGGTVYHDPQNLNFSFVTRYEPSRLHNFRFFNAPVVRVLQSLGIPAMMNDRNDILADGRKISGSAQFSSRGRMFSHGTLLFNSRLEELEEVLSARMKRIRSKSHKSVRSVVANISEFMDRPMDISEFRRYLLDGLTREGLVARRCRLSDQDREHIREIRHARYDRWEWNIGRSPKFEVARTSIINGLTVSLDLQVKKGHIEQIRIASNGCTGLEGICKALEGTRYDQESVRSVLMRIWSQPGDNGNYPFSPGFLTKLVYGEDD